ncbi:hypothetical protein BGZ73_008679 [Actinomortierella ambigua]|nr:hypothetical protein BGZ73_008679 [Actinomortierella ambigua]
MEGNPNQGGMATAAGMPSSIEDTIRDLYKDLIQATNKELESNSEDEGSSDEERQRYREKKAAKAEEIEEARKARLNPPEWDPSNPTIQRPKGKSRGRKRKTLKMAEDIVDECEDLEFAIPEGDPFDPAKPANARMLRAIQVFRQNHRFTPTGAKMFATYLSYGAMDESSQLSEEYELEVDFEYVVSSFLSHYIIHRAGIPQDAAYSIAPRVIHAFLVTLRTLNALPEYGSQIDAAIQVAKQAQEELPLVKVINTDELPFQGREWHAACYELFVANESIDLAKLDACSSSTTDDQSLSDDSSGYAQHLCGMAAIYKDVMGKLGKETRLEGVRVVRRTLPMFMTIEAIDVDKVKCHGVLQLAPHVSTDVDEEEQTEAQTTIRSVELLLPVELANKLRVGMKMDGSFYELSSGVWFGEPLTLFPSYFRRMVEVSDEVLFV